MQISNLFSVNNSSRHLWWRLTCRQSHRERERGSDRGEGLGEGQLSSGARVRFLSHSFCLTLNCCTKVLSLFCCFGYWLLAGCFLCLLFVVVWRLSILQPSLFLGLCRFIYVFIYILFFFFAGCFSTLPWCCSWVRLQIRKWVNLLLQWIGNAVDAICSCARRVFFA